MPTVAHAGIEVHYNDEGDGPAVVMLHAGASSGRQWRKVAASLPDHRIVAPDLFGFGSTSPWPGPSAMTHDDQATLVSAVMDDAGLHAAHLVGHSYGGATALRLVKQAPARVLSLVLIEPIAMPLLREAGEADLFEVYRGFARGFVDRAETGNDEEAWRIFLDTRNGAGTWDALAPDTRSRFLGLTRQHVAGFRSNLGHAGTLDDCRAIAVPTAAVLGENTTAPERRVTEVVAVAVPNCCLHEIPGAGHMSPLSHPSGVAAIIRDHVEGAIG